MLDLLGRNITYLRVSLTERCNMRCIYCRPEEGGTGTPTGLSTMDFKRIIAVAALKGVRKIRLTGGEPLLYEGLTELIEGIRSLQSIEEITLTTNGLLLKEMANELKRAGLTRVNVSLDSLNPIRFERLTRGADLGRVLEGVTAAVAAGLTPVKLNVVLMRGVNEDEVAAFADLTREQPVQVRFLELMPFGLGAELGTRAVVTSAEILRRLPDLESAEESLSETAGPARVYRLPGASGTIGLISPVSSCFCPSCNRLRLTSTGLLQPCLFSADGIDIANALRNGTNDGELARLFVEAVNSKPANWHQAAREIPDRCGRCALGRPERLMSQIGG